MDILDNPFFVLGATTRDDRRKIMGLAEEKSLLSEEEVVAEASTALTNPRKRLLAEVGWFPGFGPRRVEAAMTLVQKDPKGIYRLNNLPSLAHANLLSAALVRAVEKLDGKEITDWILLLAKAHEDIDTVSTMALINEERTVAGFPKITDSHTLETELQGRRQYYRNTIKDALNQLSPSMLLSAVTDLVETATKNGETHAPILIDDLVDSFEVEAQEFLDRETQNIISLIEKVRAEAAKKQGQTELNGLVAKLEKVVKNWDLVAQPIQVSVRSRGLDHTLSNEIAGAIRELAVELFNQYGHLEISQRLTTVIKDVFKEVDRVVEQSNEDLTALDRVSVDRGLAIAKQEDDQKKWRDEVTYQAEWGLVLKKKLMISPDYVEWNSHRLSVEHVSRIRWGATRNYVNGIPTGTTYSIYLGTRKDGFSIDLGKGDIYSEFVERLWKVVGYRLLVEMVTNLGNGKSVKFGSAVVVDTGVYLERRHLFSENEKVRCRWKELVIGNGSGTFYIAKKNDKKLNVELSYQDDDNVHVLEAVMRMFWEHPGERISDLLKKET